MTRLLYVEDDDDLRRLMEMLLGREGYDVTAVSTAEDAIRELAEHRYDLLLTDYNLPNKNADWMLEVAQAQGALRDTAVVLLTATTDPAGVNGYRRLRKPVDVSVLFAALDEAVANRAALPARAAGDEAREPALQLTLYVTKTSRESVKALRNLHRALRATDPASVDLAVHDVGDATLSPEQLDADRIVVTPTLVRRAPLPKVWLLGDLSNSELLNELIAPGRRRDGDG